MNYYYNTFGSNKHDILDELFTMFDIKEINSGSLIFLLEK